MSRSPLARGQTCNKTASAQPLLPSLPAPPLLGAAWHLFPTSVLSRPPLPSPLPAPTQWRACSVPLLLPCASGTGKSVWAVPWSRCLPRPRLSLSSGSPLLPIHTPAHTRHTQPRWMEALFLAPAQLGDFSPALWPPASAGGREGGTERPPPAMEGRAGRREAVDFCGMFCFCFCFLNRAISCSVQAVKKNIYQCFPIKYSDYLTCSIVSVAPPAQQHWPIPRWLRQGPHLTSRADTPHPPARDRQYPPCVGGGG